MVELLDAIQEVVAAAQAWVRERDRTKEATTTRELGSVEELAGFIVERDTAETAAEQRLRAALDRLAGGGGPTP